jgi:hypothetical protein
MSVPIKSYVIPAQDESGRLVLIAYRHRVVQPVGCVRAPPGVDRQVLTCLNLSPYQKRAQEINLTIIKTGDVHDRVNIVGRVQELDIAALTTIVEGLQD